MKYLVIHVLVITLLFKRSDAIEDKQSCLMMLNGTKTKENETTYYKLNCSSGRWNPLGNTAEFMVNSQTVEQLTVRDNQCIDSKANQCNVNPSSNCYCIPDQNMFSIKLQELPNTFSCIMRFNIGNEKIRKVVVNASFSGLDHVHECKNDDSSRISNDDYSRISNDDYNRIKVETKNRSKEIADGVATRDCSSFMVFYIFGVCVAGFLLVE